jgi:hypothetical protein
MSSNYRYLMNRAKVFKYFSQFFLIHLIFLITADNFEAKLFWFDILNVFILLVNLRIKMAFPCDIKNY